MVTSVYSFLVILDSFHVSPATNLSRNEHKQHHFKNASPHTKTKTSMSALWWWTAVKEYTSPTMQALAGNDIIISSSRLHADRERSWRSRPSSSGPRSAERRKLARVSP